MQQNIDIPEISLTIHNTIANTVKRATEAGKKPTVEVLGPLVSDTSFLNALQKDVSRWIREIQKVCMYGFNKRCRVERMAETRLLSRSHLCAESSAIVYCSHVLQCTIPQFVHNVIVL